MGDKTQGNQFILSLALAVFGTSMLDVLASLFLVDMAKTFLGNASLVSVAIVSQIVTISSVAAIVFGILNGVLSVRVNHKVLLLLGALCIVIGAIGCFLAPSFLFMEIFYPFDGVGTIIVGAMAFTLIGESLPLEKRAKSIGMVTAGGIISTAAGFALAGYIAVVAGWRSYLLWYVLPVSLIALGLAYISIPFKPGPNQMNIEKPSYVGSFKSILLNKSATALLFGNMLITAAGIWSFFAATFWRQHFLVPVQIVGIITLIVVVIYAIGSLIGGRMINVFGRKPLVITSWVSRGLLIMAVVFMPNFWSAFLTSCVATLIGGIAVASGNSLNLEQVPESRGTMMSLAGVFGSAGASLGVAAGGLALGTMGYQLLGTTLGAFGIGSAAIVFFFAKDPTKL